MRKLNIEKAQEIIDIYVSNNVTTSELANKFNISQSTIGEIINGYIYSSCIRPENIKNIAKEKFKVRFNQYNNSLPPLTDEQNNIIIGSLLGDGWMGQLKGNSNSHFGKGQCLNSYEHIIWVYEKLSPYTDTTKIYKNFTTTEAYWDKENKKTKTRKIPRTHKSWSMLTCNHPIFTELRKKWYPNGIKIIPSDIELNPQILSIWYVDDGTNNYKDRFINISTNCFELNDIQILIEKITKKI